MANKVGLDSIKFDKSNANKGTVRGRGMIESSIREFGFADAGTLDKNNVIIGGNKRTEVAGEIGMDEAIIIDVDGTKPVFIRRPDMDLSDPEDDKARRLAYVLNRSSEVSLAWDAEQLLADMTAGIDLSNIFDTEELDAMLAGLVAPEPVEDAPPDVSKADELQKKWQTSLGQMWQLGKHRLICGDCTDKATMERLMGGEKATMMFTDPPYGVSFEGQLLSNTTVDGVQVNHHVGANAKHDDIKNDALTGEELTKFCVDFLTVAKSTGMKAWYICFSQLYFDSILIAMRKSNLEWRSIIAWVKNQATLSNRDYKMRYEPIVYGQSGGAFHGERYHEEDVWEITRTLKNDLHPTMKPVDLAVRAINNSSVSGDIVYEPFSGSGTTIIACQSLSRQCRAIELDAGYVAITLQRFQDATVIEPVLIS